MYHGGITAVGPTGSPHERKKTVMRGRRAIGTGLAAALTAGAAWIGIDAATAGSDQGVSGSAAIAPDSDRLATPGWHGRAVGSVAQAMQLAGRNRTLTLVTEQKRARRVDVGAEGFSTGDFFVFEETVFNARGGEVIGEDTVRCEIGIRTFTCDATIKLDSRGKITVGGAFFSRRDNVIPVTGGTGNFKGVGGELRVFDLRGRKALLVFELVR